MSPISPLTAVDCHPVRDTYESLLQAQPDAAALARAGDFLDTQLVVAEMLPCDLPDSPEHMLAWGRAEARRTTEAYASYLQTRKRGEPRRYFSNLAHALYFLRAVAPTKLVDGAWLYGLLPHWPEVRLQPLIQTYLEELGNGVAAQNHVLLYRQLLAENGCDELGGLSDAHYIQGTQQLALGHLAERYLPELIGYNLGYEQLPLHLLISTYELRELGIDPYYFQLHVTIDNASCGHAQRAVQALQDNLPVVGDRQAFLRRVNQGYRLNQLGLGSTRVIADFDLERELLAMLERKRQVAGTVHSDHCRLDGRTINQWLAESGNMPGFLAALQARGWLHRHQDPSESRFWQLVDGPRAAMFGVFSGYERQLLHDWIAGDWQPAEQVAPQRRRNRDEEGPEPVGDFASETRTLLAQLEGLAVAEQNQRLIQLMTPALHHSPAGLMATRLFSASYC
ncbi:iron-containing redox enzyme family protein [Pseudomonas sp. Gutcm_11s]|uniref:iron-containing redox enzyme family protein n=1 Tax=Pseudomonas sp. Gutcm_11s TaxID=3026088 RepID=UPI00236154F9|nr:iron-containing redox enzyme family protein [Pseudomonas sp. Gutcm_11s]MDD0843568.1 iron-containing redox enzyme family protein [Pseudomonas sp. Gutcm_11s]